MKLTREEVLKLAEKAGFFFHVLPELAPTQHTEPHQYSEECFHRFAALLSVHLAKPLAESAVAPGECGSVPDALAKIAKALAVVVGLCDGSKRWTMSVPADVENDPDLVIADALATARRVLEAGMQPPNNQPNSDHVAVTSAEPESSVPDGFLPMESAPLDGTEILLLTNTGIVSAWFAKGEWNEHYENGSEYTGPAWVCYDDAFQIEVEETGHHYRSEAIGWMPKPGQSGISSKYFRSNEKDVVGEGK